MIFHAFYANDGIVSDITNWTRFFMIPIFFVISGFLFKDKLIRKFIETRAKRILLTHFVALTLTTILVFILWSGTREVWEKYVFGILYSDLRASNIALLANNTLWFLPCFFVAELIFLLEFKFIDSTPRRKILIVMLISFIGVDISTIICLPWGIDTAMAMQIFILAGYFLKERFDKISTLQLILIALIVIPTAELNQRVDTALRIYNNPIFYFLDGILGSILIFKLSQLISNRFLNFIGRKTLSILILHSPIFFVIEFLGSDPTSTLDCWIKFFIAITIILSIEKFLEVRNNGSQ